MALNRYRHFWSSRLERTAMRSAGPGDISGGAADSEITDVDMVGVLKSYSPPRIVREVRQVETGKYLNERILGRLQPEETNFSITIPSDFEIFYGYNHDYWFEIAEELHNNNNANVRFAVDDVVGTLFDRDWTDFSQAGSDRDLTLHFILKRYTRVHSDDVNGLDNAVVLMNIRTGLDGADVYFRTRGADPTHMGMGVPMPVANRSMFEGNQNLLVTSSTGTILANPAPP